MQHMEKIIAELLPKLEKENRFVLGLDGLSRSGKTTFTAELVRHLRERNFEAVALHLDDYIVERKRRYHTGEAEWFEYYGLQWDVEGLREHLFGRVGASGSLSLPRYESESDDHRMQEIVLPDRGVVVIEGVFLQRGPWREYLDGVIYLDCPREVRFARESPATRQNTDKFVNRYWQAEDHYLAAEDPLSQADWIVKEYS